MALVRQKSGFLARILGAAGAAAAGAVVLPSLLASKGIAKQQVVWMPYQMQHRTMQVICGAKELVEAAALKKLHMETNSIALCGD